MMAVNNDGVNNISKFGDVILLSNSYAVYGHALSMRLTSVGMASSE
jgi:hypothetical protein